MTNNGMPTRVRKLVLGLLTNPWAIGCFSILAFQQLIEASATYWLVTLTVQVTSGGNYFPYLIIYLLSLLLPYIPGCVAQILKTGWKQEAQKSFVNSFVSVNKDNIGEWGNKGLKQNKLSILTAEGPNTLHLFIDYAWDLYTYSLNIILNITFLSLVVEPLFVVSYAISVSCVMVIMSMRRHGQRQLTQKAMIARVDLAQSLLAAWDNVLLGNRYNFKLWNERTSQRLKRCLHRNNDMERSDQILAITVALITSIPSLIVVILSMLKYHGDIVRMTSFVVILPLLFLILSYTYQTLSLIFRWGMHRSKLITIYRAIEPATESPSGMEKKVKWGKIVATHSSHASDNTVSLKGPHAMTSHEDLLSHTKDIGRLTLRGENGSGKSTALMLIKDALAERAFLLPTHSQLSFISETNKYSTGESLYNRLVEILNRVDVDVLLLDEWDANLDSENQERLSLLIDEIALRKCVIEVRHR